MLFDKVNEKDHCQYINSKQSSYNLDKVYSFELLNFGILYSGDSNLNISYNVYAIVINELHIRRLDYLLSFSFFSTYIYFWCWMCMCVSL